MWSGTLEGTPEVLDFLPGIQHFGELRSLFFFWLVETTRPQQLSKELRPSEKFFPPGNSAGDLFGMVKWPRPKVK